MELLPREEASICVGSGDALPTAVLDEDDAEGFVELASTWHFWLCPEDVEISFLSLPTLATIEDVALLLSRSVDIDVGTALLL